MVRSLLAAAATALAVTPAALGGPSPHMRDLCKDEGFTRVVGISIDDPNIRVAFRNQGQCVSFANHGGQLRAIDDPNA